MKVHCGYPDCDWVIANTIRPSEPTEISHVIILNDLQSKLLDHHVKVHNVPPAIWESDSDGQTY